MSYSLEIRPDALADIDEAAGWYEEREPRLGLEFRSKYPRGHRQPSTASVGLPYPQPSSECPLVRPIPLPYRIIYRVHEEQSP